LQAVVQAWQPMQRSWSSSFTQRRGGSPGSLGSGTPLRYVIATRAA
jgi:hypothetical protein